MIQIKVRSTFKNQVPVDLVRRAVQATLDHNQASPNFELTIVVENDPKLRSLNRRYLGIDAATDVLAFPAEEMDPDEQLQYIGDVIISYPRAEYQASQAGHPIENELCLLVVHGVLHLLGYDHAKEDEKNRMWAAQTDILTNINISIRKYPD